MFMKRFVLSALIVSAAIYLSGCGGSSAPISVSVTASANTVDATNAVTLSALVSRDKNGAGVSWSVSGGGTIAGSTSSATYTAPAASKSALTVTVTATSIADATKHGTATITVPAAPSITTSAMSAGIVGTAYSLTLAGSGGISPYTWTITNGTLPAGLTMSSAGVISGTPTAGGAGTANLTFKATDSGKPNPLTATANLSLTVAAAPPIVFGGNTLTDGTMNVAYTGALSAMGGAGTLTYTIAAGKFPDGVSMSTAGALTGTPTKTGTFPVTVQAADAFGDTATQAYTIKIGYPALAVTALTPPIGYVGSNYTQTTLAATGGSGTGFVWAVSNGSALPDGLALSTAGVLTGKPTTKGATTTNLTVTDSATNTASGTLTFTIKDGISVLSAGALPKAYSGSNYSQQLTASGGSGTGYTWTVGTPNAVRAHVVFNPGLPDGMSLSSSGLLSGKPTQSGSWEFTLTVTDSANNSASGTFDVTVSPGITINSLSLPKGYQGVPYPGATFTATGGSNSGYSWSWTAAGSSSLPAGLSLSAAGAVSGTSTSAGAFSLVVTVTDSASNTAAQTFSLTVEATLTISSPAMLKSGSTNVAYSTMLTATGGSGTYSAWTVTQGVAELQTLSLNLSADGVLAGTPTQAGSATFTALVTDSENHTATASLTVAVYSALTITTNGLPAGTVGTAYSQTLTAGGGTGSGYTWSATGSNLATYGLTLSAAGVVSGTPTTVGTATLTPTVTDSSNNTATAVAPLTILVYGALSLPATNPASLPSTGTTGVAYTGSVIATGGSGNYTWTITGMPADGLSANTVGGTLNVIGTPTSAATVTFTAAVKDTTTNVSVGPNTYTITVTNPVPVSLPAPNPTSLSSATVNQSYIGVINASGGISPFTWSINGSAVPTNGTPLSLTNGLSATNTGGNTLTISGTPTATGTVTLTNVKVVDSLSSNASNTYTILVNSAGAQVNGQIFLNTGCGGGSTVPQITVSINTTPVQQVTTDSNGNYSFGSISNGTYTITPSIAGASSVFYPATLTNVVVNNNQLNGEDFSVALGYSVNGAVSYGGTQTGRVYLNLNNNSCGGSGGEGTSIPFHALYSGGAFTINGVPPGSYTLLAYMDNVGNVGNGSPNATNPSDSVSVTVSNANITGVFASLVDPTVSAPTTAPTIQTIEPTDLGVVINFKPITNNYGVETVTSYNLEWSTTSTFTSPSSITFTAKGTKANVWILNNSTAGIAGSFSNGTAYYFRAQGSVTAGVGPWKAYGSPTPITIGALSGAGTFTVSGKAIIPSDITITGPLYVGLYDQNTNSIFATRIASPTNATTGNAYTISVPNGSNYFFFGILDHNNDGQIDAGDVTNTDNGNAAAVVVTGNVTGLNETLPDVNSTATVQTQYNQNSYWNGTVSQTTINYNLNFDLRGANKLPVAVQLASASNPNVITPVDISNLCQGCSSPQFNLNANIATDVPVVNDSYTFNVTYFDGTTGVVMAKVTSVLGASALATNLEPEQTDSTSTSPTFTWTYPSSASSYTYQFWLCCNTNGTIWSIPGNNSKSNGFTNTQIPGTLTWGVDPTDSNNVPTLPSLTSGTSYNWSIQAQDSNGNSAQNSVWYQP